MVELVDAARLLGLLLAVVERPVLGDALRHLDAAEVGADDGGGVLLDAVLARKVELLADGLGERRVVGAGGVDPDKRVRAVRKRVVAPARHDDLGRLGRVAKHRAQRGHRLLGDLVVVLLLEGDGRLAGEQREQHRQPRRVVHVEEEEELAALRLRGGRPPEEVGAVRPEGAREEERHLVEHAEAEAVDGLQLGGRERRREADPALRLGALEHAERHRQHERVGEEDGAAGRHGADAAAARPQLHRRDRRVEVD